MMTLEESCILFQIEDLNKIDKKMLKKKYYEMCLKYHPDKTKNKEDQFIKMTECYKTLNTYIDNNSEDYCDNPCYNKNEPDVNYNNLFSSLISLISIDNIKYIINLVDSYKIYMNHTPEIITLNITLQQVFDRRVYINNDHYIPLWHNIVHRLSVKDQQHIIYIIKINDIPSNIRILKNNDIIINISKHNIKKNAFNNIYICQRVEFDIYISSSEYEKAFVVLKNRGIPKTNINDIFDTSQISDIHLHLV